MNLTNLEHQTLNQLKEFNQKSLLLAISGGLDSMVLLEIMYRLQPVLKLQLLVAHVHHGPSPPTQTFFRTQAQEKVVASAKAKGLDFVTNTGDNVPPNSSEAGMRDFRYAHLETWAKPKGLSITTAHHSDDLLETQLLRLIRGVGPQGLPSMTSMGHQRFRPLLPFTRSDLEKYAEENKVSFLEDPSNESTNHLRNWLRQNWLPQLEKKSPGATISLGRSLRLLSQDLRSPQLKNYCHSGKLDLKSLLPLTRSQKSSVVAQFMKAKGLKNYGQSHIEEALKHFDLTSHDFHLLQHQWSIGQGQVSLEISRKGKKRKGVNE